MDIRTAIRNLHRDFDNIDINDKKEYNKIEDKIVELETRTMSFEDMVDSEFEICPFCKSEEVTLETKQTCDFCGSEWVRKDNSYIITIYGTLEG